MSRTLQRVGRFWMSLKASGPALRLIPSERKWTPFTENKACYSTTFLSTKTHRQCQSNDVKLVEECKRQYSSTKSTASVGQKGQFQSKTDDDRIKLFIDPQVQILLRELTGRDLKRIFRKRKIGQKIREPKYSFMTEEQLEEARKEAEERADQLLQMPPVLRPRKPIDEVLDFDPLLQGYDKTKSTLIFTDITMNVSDRDRIVVARDCDGTLRQATWDERDKVNAIYFPLTGREFLTPSMFTDPGLLQQVLDRASELDNTYEYILDRACLQFEPDNPTYISVVEFTYDAVDERGNYDLLKSTRHFGPMVFYLVRKRKMDGILLHSVKQRRISTDAVKLVELFHIIFPECKSKALLAEKSLSDVDKVKAYIHLDGIRRGELELALNAYLEAEEASAELEDNLKAQHGITNN